MPHLTPMNWILMLSMIWLLLHMINLTQWWNSPLKFSSQITTSKQQTMKKWVW